MVPFHLLFLLYATIPPKIRVFFDLFLLFPHDHSTIQNIRSFFIYSFFCARLFNQKLESLLIYLFYLPTTIRPRYMVLFYLFFLLCTTIWPKIRALTYLLLLCASDHSIKVYDLFFFCPRQSDQNICFFVLSFCKQPLNLTRAFIDLFLLFVHDHSTKTYGPLLFILCFLHDHSTKN